MKTETHMISPQHIKQLSMLRPWRTIAAGILDWAVIAGAITASTCLRYPAVYLAAVVVIAGRMHALGILMHEIAHYRFLKKRRVLAEWLGNIFAAWPLLATVDGYRRNHLAHHRHTNTDDDPDWTAKKNYAQFSFPQRLSRGIIHLFGYVIVINTVRDLRRMMPALSRTTRDSKAHKAMRIAFYLTVLVMVGKTGTWLGLLLYWFVPYFTFLFMFQHIRSVAEHFGGMDYSHKLSSTRTIKPYFWERWFFAPHNINYHLEHHLCPSVPFYNLPQLHRRLFAEDYFRKHARITRGYSTGLIKECFSLSI